MNMYEEMGTQIALQYGGRRRCAPNSNAAKDFLQSVKRFYRNTFTDVEKQHIMDVFLGVFVPQAGSPHIWGSTPTSMHNSRSRCSTRRCPRRCRCPRASSTRRPRPRRRRARQRPGEQRGGRSWRAPSQRDGRGRWRGGGGGGRTGGCRGSGLAGASPGERRAGGGGRGRGRGAAAEGAAESGAARARPRRRRPRARPRRRPPAAVATALRPASRGRSQLRRPSLARFAAPLPAVKHKLRLAATDFTAADGGAASRGEGLSPCRWPRAAVGAAQPGGRGARRRGGARFAGAGGDAPSGWCSTLLEDVARVPLGDLRVMLPKGYQQLDEYRARQAAAAAGAGRGLLRLFATGRAALRRRRAGEGGDPSSAFYAAALAPCTVRARLHICRRRRRRRLNYCSQLLLPTEFMSEGVSTLAVVRSREAKSIERLP